MSSAEPREESSVSPQADRKAQRLDEKLTHRRFEDEGVRSALDEMDIDTLISVLGEPARVTRYAEQRGWAVGDGRPLLADEDPAVMQAIGRCATNRVRHGLAALVNLGPIHNGECAWCPYPLEQLLEACAWGVMSSRFVVADLLVWTNADHQTYVRAGGLTGYQNPAWRALFEMPVNERARLVELAAQRTAA